jgi:hypothetical protein
MSTNQQIYPPPPILYKYCPPERLDILWGCAVRFTPPTEFNDTFDTRHPVTGTREIRLAQLKFRATRGILCLTETADDHLMWVHYARNHTGFVVGFDAQSAFFRDEGRLLAPVHYAEPSIIPVPSQPELDEPGIAFYKSPAWSYEREWRCVKRFRTDESRLVSFEPQLIREIVIGHKTGSSLVAELVSWVAGFSIQENVQFFLSTPSPAEWRFVHVPKVYSFCDHCNGQGYTVSQK